MSTNQETPHPPTGRYSVEVLNMNTTNTAVNLTQARGLKYRQFLFLLQDLDTEHTHVYYSTICWLGFGKSSRQCEKFLDTGDLMFPKLKDENWKNDLKFLVDIFSFLCEDLYIGYTQQYMLPIKTAVFPNQVTENEFKDFSTL
jgi:hypothetical protein